MEYKKRPYLTCYKCKEKFDRNSDQIYVRKGGGGCICKPCNRKRVWESNYRLKKYGIGTQEYDRLLIEQDYKCKICGKPHRESKGQRLYIDHDHDSLSVRGLLCMRCNIVLGFVRDNPDLLMELAEYVS